MSDALFIGIDIGTSGCRACAIDEAGRPLAFAETPLPPSRPDDRGHAEQRPQHWWDALLTTLARLSRQIPVAHITHLALDGTSGTLLVCDTHGTPLTPALMYNDRRSNEQARRIAELAPAESGAHGAGSSLAKLLWLQDHAPLPTEVRALHQADWLLGKLGGEFVHSDENNCLKLGYDPVRRRWPAWLGALGIAESWLPQAHAPGTVVATLSAAVAERLGWPAGVRLVAGTTDSLAATLATGAGEIGDAVTSLGSTLVLKVFSERPVFAPEYGIYSHRLGERWLAGGASNCGGAVLKQLFSDAEIQRFSATLQPDQPTGLDYYPLPGPGERFPHNDPDKRPRLEPLPADRGRYFQGLLESLARIEHEGYQRLHEQGAPYPRRVFSVGGGAANPGWEAIRGNQLGVRMLRPQHDEAAYGAALLARQATRPG